MTRLFSLIPLALIATGCAGNAVSANIDGQRAGVGMDGFYVEVDDAFDDDDGLIVIVLNDAGWADPCEAAVDLEDEFDDADDAGELADVWEEFFPGESWQAFIEIRVDDLDDDQSGELFDGADADDDLGEEEASASLVHYLQPLDEDFYEGDVDYEDYISSWVSDRGDLIVNSHVPGERIKGSFTTEIGTAEYDADSGWDYDAVGDAKFSFNVQRCRDAEEFFE